MEYGEDGYISLNRIFCIPTVIVCAPIAALKSTLAQECHVHVNFL